jgi:hypothetical protein
LRLRQKYQAPTANKKAEGTAVVYRSKFGSPMSQMGQKQTSQRFRAMSASLRSFAVVALAAHSKDSSAHALYSAAVITRALVRKLPFSFPLASP